MSNKKTIDPDDLWDGVIGGEWPPKDTPPAVEMTHTDRCILRLLLIHYSEEEKRELFACLQRRLGITRLKDSPDPSNCAVCGGVL